ncbi:MAG: DUF2608 domain-containing protein [Oligoflexales bacterium]
MIFLKIFVLFFFLTSFAQGHPFQEIFKIQEIEPSLKERSLVVFDLDLTLIHPNGSLALPQAFDAQIQKIINADDINRKRSTNCLIAEYSASLAFTSFNLIEEDSPIFLKSLIENYNCETLGLTARGLETVSSTNIHLQTHNIQFSNKIKYSYEKEFFHNPNFREPILMSQGVVYASGQHKGLTLKHILDAKAHTPEHIVFIDDTVKNIHQMNQTCIENNWSCSLFLYKRMHKWSKQQNVSNIEEQREHTIRIMNTFWK